jgi:choline kinase
MRVASLVAGRCTRLLPLTASEHKAMLEVDGRRIVDLQIDTFLCAGLNEAVFVVGHGGKALSEHVLRASGQLQIQTIENIEFDNRNLDWSTYLALASRPGDVLYYEGDVIADPNVIRDVAFHSSDIAIAVDVNGQSDRIDTMVIGSGGRVKRLLFAEHGNVGHDRPHDGVGEFVCMVKLSDQARRRAVSLLEQGSFEGPMVLYSIFDRLFSEFEASYVITNPRPWLEIDNAADLSRAASIANEIRSKFENLIQR